MSRKGLRQWAAVRRTRGLNTRAEQKPALSPPRISTIATRSAKRPSGSAPTSARAGASGAASAATNASDRRKRERGDVIGPASCARTRCASIARPRIAAFPPAFARVVRLGLQSRALTIHIAFSRKRQHGPARIRNRGFVVMAALAMVCRAAAWCALMCSRGSGRWGGCGSVGCPRPRPPKPSRASRRSRSVSTPPRRARWSSRVICSSRSRRSNSPARNARPRRCRRSSAAPGTISFTRSLSCIGTGASCMSRWRLATGKIGFAPAAGAA